MWIAVNGEDERLARFKPFRLPLLFMLSADGALVTSVTNVTYAGLTRSVDDGKKAEQDFQADLGKADLSKPAERLAFVRRRLARCEVGATVALVAGFAENASPERLEAVEALLPRLLHMAYFEEAESLLETTSRVFTSPNASKADERKIAELWELALVNHLNKAKADGKKALCLSLLDRLVKRVPEKYASRRDELRAAYERMP